MQLKTLLYNLSFMMVVVFFGSCTTLQNMTKIVKPSPRAVAVKNTNIEFLDNLGTFVRCFKNKTGIDRFQYCCKSWSITQDY